MHVPLVEVRSCRVASVQPTPVAPGLRPRRIPGLADGAGRAR